LILAYQNNLKTQKINNLKQRKKFKKIIFLKILLNAKIKEKPLICPYVTTQLDYSFWGFVELDQSDCN
jgi:hypothetical protein